MTAPRDVVPEIDVCAKCGDNTAFEWVEEEGEFLSVCCTARPMPMDVEAPECCRNG